MDQFGFGIKKNPLAIKNFIRFARNKFSSPLKNVFIIGRGVAYHEFRIRESDPVASQLNLVPSWGNPASDNMLSSEDAASPIGITPIGRLSVVRGKEVEDYLRSCEHLISVPVASHQPPFSPDELAMLKYYAAEVVKMLGQLTKV